MTQSLIKKNLEMFLGTKLDFHEHLKNMFNKVNKKIGLLGEALYIFPRLSLLLSYKPFIRLRIDYDGIIHDQTYNASLN